MVKFYRVEYKDCDEAPRHYTTLTALAEDNPRERIGVSLSWLQKIDFSSRCYEGKRFKIQRFEAWNKADVIRKRKQE